MPANLFYGTGIPACIIVIDKENADSREGVFMMDASKGYIKDGPKNRLREQDLHKIVDAFNDQLELDKYSERSESLIDARSLIAFFQIKDWISLSYKSPRTYGWMIY